MYGGGSNQASPLKQPPARREPKKKSLEDLKGVSPATLSGPSAILQQRKREEKHLARALVPRDYSQDEIPEPYTPKSSRPRELTALVCEQLRDIPPGVDHIFVRSPAMAELGHGCGYLRVDTKTGDPFLRFNVEPKTYCGRCALTSKVCTSSPDQKSENCGVYTRFFEALAQKERRKQEKYASIDILPVLEEP